MAIIKKAAKPAAIDPLAAFIEAAPDAKPATPSKTVKMSGSKAIISVSLAPEILQKLDEWAKVQGVSRSAAIITAIKKLK